MVTIAQAINVRRDSVRRAIEAERFQPAEPLRPSILNLHSPRVTYDLVGLTLRLLFQRHGEQKQRLITALRALPKNRRQ